MSRTHVQGKEFLPKRAWTLLKWQRIMGLMEMGQQKRWMLYINKGPPLKIMYVKEAGVL